MNTIFRDETLAISWSGVGANGVGDRVFFVTNDINTGTSLTGQGQVNKNDVLVFF